MSVTFPALTEEYKLIRKILKIKELMLQNRKKDLDEIRKHFQDSNMEILMDPFHKEYEILMEKRPQKKIPLSFTLVEKYSEADRLQNEVIHACEEFPAFLNHVQAQITVLQQRSNLTRELMEEISADLKQLHEVKLKFAVLQEKKAKSIEENREELQRLSNEIQYLLNRQRMINSYLIQHKESKLFMNLLVGKLTYFPETKSVVEYYQNLKVLNKKFLMKESKKLHETEHASLLQKDMENVVRKHRAESSQHRRYITNKNSSKMIIEDKNDLLRCFVNHKQITGKVHYLVWVETHRWIRRTCKKIYAYEKQIYQPKESILNQLEKILEFIFVGKSVMAETRFETSSPINAGRDHILNA